MGVPAWVGQCLEREPEIVKLARKFKNTKHMLYLGRGINMPIAYEGALKLKRNIVYPCRGLPGGRDEARTDRADRQDDARGGAGAERPLV